MENEIISITINLDDENDKKLKLSNSYIKQICNKINNNNYILIDILYKSKLNNIENDRILFDKSNNFTYTKYLDFSEYTIFEFDKLFSEKNIYPLDKFILLNKDCTNILIDYIRNCEIYNDKLYIFKDDIIQIYDKGLKPLLNTKYYYSGNYELNMEYNLIIVFDENGNCGIIDLDGNIVLDLMYKHIEIIAYDVHVYKNKSMIHYYNNPSLILKISDLFENQKLENNINFLMKSIYEND